MQLEMVVSRAVIFWLCEGQIETPHFLAREKERVWIVLVVDELIFYPC